MCQVWKYVDRFIDRHGKTRQYYRRPNGPRIRLDGDPGTDEFARSYLEAARSQYQAGFANGVSNHAE